MTEKNEFVPERLREVWEWKDSIYREVAHLPVEEGLKEILEKGERSVQGVRAFDRQSGKRRPQGLKVRRRNAFDCVEMKNESQAKLLRGPTRHAGRRDRGGGRLPADRG